MGKKSSHSKHSSRKVFHLFVCFSNMNVFYVEKLCSLKMHSLESLVVLVLLSTHKHPKAVGVTMYIRLICTKGRGKKLSLELIHKLIISTISGQWCVITITPLSQFYPQLPSLFTKYQIQLQYFKILLLCFMWNCYWSLLLRSWGKSPCHIPFSSWPPLLVEVFLTTYRFAMTLLPETVSIFFLWLRVREGAAMDLWNMAFLWLHISELILLSANIWAHRLADSPDLTTQTTRWLRN